MAAQTDQTASSQHNPTLFYVDYETQQKCEQLPHSNSPGDCLVEAQVLVVFSLIFQLKHITQEHRLCTQNEAVSHSLC